MSSSDTDLKTGITRHFDVKIPISSETVYATRYEPQGFEQPLPCLFVYYPYRRDLHLTDGNDAHVVEYLVKSGYQVVIADMVGTGSSSGYKSSFKEREREGKEAAEVIDWIADQAWCTGRVGMYGKSYGGQTALNAAVQQPDALEAIVPMHTSHTAYSDFAYEGGIYNPFWRCGHWFPQMQALRTLPPSIRDPEGHWAEHWNDRLDRLGADKPWMFKELEHDVLDEFWVDEGFDIARIEVPTFVIGGWRDQFPQETIQYFEQLTSTKRLLMGPWRHLIPHRGREFAIDARQQIVEWFDRFLKDTENGALDHAPVEFWTERNGGKPNQGVWRSTDTWPRVGNDPDDAVSLAVTPQGLVEANAFERGEVLADYKPDHSVGLDSVDYPLVTKPLDTGEDDRRSLSYETEPVTDPVEFTGSGVANVHLSSTDPDPSIAVRVIDVDEEGNSRIITHGRLKVSHRGGHDGEQPVEPGEVYSLNVPLRPRSHVFEAGHRIRIALSGDFFPITVPSPGGGSIRLHSSPSRPTSIEFPGRIHDGEVSFPDAETQNEPDELSVPRDLTYARQEGGEWITAREHLQDGARFSTDSSREIELPQGGNLDYHQAISANIRSGDPQSLVIRSETEITLELENEVATVEVNSRFTPKQATLTNCLTIDNQTVFDKKWRY